MSHTFKMNNSSCPPLLKCQKDAAPYQLEANTFSEEYTRKQRNLRNKTNLKCTTTDLNTMISCRRAQVKTLKGEKGRFRTENGLHIRH